MADRQIFTISYRSSEGNWRDEALPQLSARQL